MYSRISLALIFTLEAASMCHFLSASIKFSCFPSNEIRHLCILSFALALSSVTHLSVDIRIQSKKKKTYSDLLSFFLSKSLGGHAIYRQKRAGARNANFLPALMKGGRTSVRTYVYVILTEQVFLPMGLRSIVPLLSP